jgi:hypothetical protein
MRWSLAQRPKLLIGILIPTLAFILPMLAPPASGQPQVLWWQSCNVQTDVSNEMPASRFAALPGVGSPLSLRLDLRGPAMVRWSVFDVGGRRVATRDYGTLGGGAHAITWDGSDRHGRGVAAGIYWVQIQAGNRLIVRQVDCVD